MKKIFLILASLFLSARIVYASPPTSIDVTYDSATKEITAIIYHQSYDIKKHYINVVRMMINGVPVNTERFHWQHSAREQTAVFGIPSVKPGDVITIQAFCNKGGERSQDVKIK
jgi:hypothetical protein